MTKRAYMPVIITATDFSEVATNAVHYACNLAAANNASVTVVHSYIIPVTFNDTPMPVIPVDEGRRVAEDSINALIGQLKQQYPDISIKGHITYGDITDSLQEIAEELKPMFVVVGNSSQEDATFWLGSNLISALKNLPYPVIAVPTTASYEQVNNICFACDYKQVTDKLPAAELIALVKKTSAQLHVLNVDYNNKEFGTDTPLQSELLHKLLDPINPQYHFISNQNIDEGIHQFIESKEMDWLVVIPHKHSFFEGLFHKSHTKAIVRISTLPIIALHEKK